LAISDPSYLESEPSCAPSVPDRSDFLDSDDSEDDDLTPIRTIVGVDEAEELIASELASMDASAASKNSMILEEMQKSI
jgi:hypothetical protein